MLVRLARSSGVRTVRRVVVAVIGGTVTLTGVALLVLPGPAFIVIPVGLAILATEFLWAKRLLRKARDLAASLQNKPPKPEAGKDDPSPAGRSKAEKGNP
jgi:tellurite resistance protein TerC